ncbi:MAG: hypothetical protein MHM6MM_003550 [Cercozoa sp. M6MM]
MLSEALRGEGGTMERHGTQLGLALSGRKGPTGSGSTIPVSGSSPVSALAEETEAERIRQQEAELANYEKSVRLAEEQRDRFFRLIDSEAEARRIASAQLRSKWRKVLSEIHSAEAEKKLQELESDAAHEHTRRDTLFEQLSFVASALDEQTSRIQSAHARFVARMQDIKRLRARELETQLDLSARGIDATYSAARESARKSLNSELKIVQLAHEAIARAERAALEERKNADETGVEELRNRHLEELNVVKVQLQTQIQEMEHRFEVVHASYVDNTEEKAAHYVRLRDKDAAMNKQVTSLITRIEAAETRQREWQQRLAALQSDIGAANSVLRGQKAQLLERYRILRHEMESLTSQQSEKLADLCEWSSSCVERNTEMLDLATKILQLAEVNSRHLTAKEKAQPFFRSSLTSVSLSLSGGGTGTTGTLQTLALREEETEENEEAPEEQLAPEPVATASSLKTPASTSLSPKRSKKKPRVGASGNSDTSEQRAIAELATAAAQIAPLENLFKLLNTVRLDICSIESMNAQLRDDNAQLETLTRQLMSDVTVTKYTLDAPNTLLVVNGRSSLPADAMRSPNDFVPMVDGVGHLRDTNKQLLQ